MDKTALYKLSYGLYVVGVNTDKWFGGCVVDALAQITADDPPQLILSSMRKNFTNVWIKSEGIFTVSVLPADVDPFIVANFGFQSARAANKWANVPHTVIDGLPVLDCAVAFLRCRITEVREFSTHSLFFCVPTDGQNRAPQASPLIYGDYQRDMRAAASDAFKKFNEGKIKV